MDEAFAQICCLHSAQTHQLLDQSGQQVFTIDEITTYLAIATRRLLERKFENNPIN